MSPKMPDPIIETARAMLPAGFELEIVDQSDPKFPTAMLDADFFLGFARGGMGPEFYRASPKLELNPLISAGYDGIDVEAARAAKLPVANNNGANSVAVSRAHPHAHPGRGQEAGVAAQQRGGRQVAHRGLRGHAPLRGARQDAWYRGARQHRQESGPARAGLRDARESSTSCV